MPPQPPLAAIRAIMRARDVLHRAGDALMPAEMILLEQSFGIARTQVIGAVAELGVADLLSGGPRTAEQLAAALDVDADALHRVLRGAAAFGLLRRPRHVRVAVARRASRRGGPLRGRDAAGDRAHGSRDRRGVPWPGSGTVCDVAGGVGTLLAAILAARPGLRGVLVDAPGPLGEADGFLRARGVRDRVELVQGDIFSGVSARADCFVLKDVLHDWDDERCGTILRTVRATMQPGERVVLVETLQERNDTDLIASLSDVQMLTQCDGGRQRAEADLHRLLRETGFEPGPTHATAGPALVEATRGS